MVTEVDRRDPAISPERRILGGWGTVFLVAVGAAVAQSFGRFTYGVLLPAVRDTLGLTNTVAGLLGTINVGAYLVGTIVVATAASRFRLIDVMRVGFLFSTAGLVGAALAPNVVVLAIALFSTGFGGACIWIPAPVIAADSMPPEKRALAVGFMGSGIGAGIVFSGQLASAIRGRYGDEAWQTVYAIEAAIGVAVLALTLLLVRHTQQRPTGRRAGLGGFAVLKKMEGWKALTLAYTAYGFSYLLIIAFLTTRLEDDSGWTPARASTAFTVLGLAVVVGGPLFITLARRYGPRNVMVTCFVLWALMAGLILTGWFIPTMLGSVGVGALFAAVPAIITLFVVEHTSVDDYGPSFAAATLAFGVAQMLAPQVGGALADATGSFTPVFILSAAFALCGATAALRLPRRETTERS